MIDDEYGMLSLFLHEGENNYRYREKRKKREENKKFAETGGGQQ